MKTALAGIALAYCLLQVNAGCFCGLPSGKDVCHSSGTPEGVPLVVRPKTLPKVEFQPVPERIIVKPPKPSLPSLKSFGDLCSGKRTIVTPAVVPRPGCFSCNKVVKEGGKINFFDRIEEHHHNHHNHHNHGFSSSGVSYGTIHGSSGSSGSCGRNGHSGTVIIGGNSGSSTSNLYGCSSGAFTYAESAPYTKPVVPADPVSLSLAYKMQHNQVAGTTEDKLNFGFRVMPKDVKIEKKVNHHIPEENLFRHNGEIVELKKVSVAPKKSLDEEAAEDLIEEDSISQEVVGTDSNGVKQLSYQDIGFGPASIKSGKFTKVTVNAPIKSDVEEHSAAVCNDGFVAGKVIVQNVAPKEEIYYASKPTIPCGGSVETVKYPAFGWSSSSSSSSQNSHASSSSCNSHFFSKLDD